MVKFDEMKKTKDSASHAKIQGPSPVVQIIEIEKIKFPPANLRIKEKKKE